MKAVPATDWCGWLEQLYKKDLAWVEQAAAVGAFPPEAFGPALPQRAIFTTHYQTFRERDRAGLLNIQKLQSIKPSGREYHPATLMALREAGERHHDLNGGDHDVSAKAAGYSRETKAGYYKKVNYEEAQKSYARNYPAFVEDGI